MTITDYHTHSYRCGHAVGRMDEYIESAIARRLDEIGLTEHLYLYFDPPDKRDSRWAMDEAEFPVHYEEMLELREHYKDRIKVLVSVEADYVKGHEDRLRRILGEYEFDYVLGSVHFIDGWLIDDPDQAHRYREERVTEIYRRYFTNLQNAMRLGVFDVIAHFDLPKKFGFLPEDDLGEIVSETLDLAKEMDVAIEVSTVGLRTPTSEIYPSRVILHEMKRRDIPIVLSSDAHAPDEVGFGYEESLQLLRDVGYGKVATFDAGVRQLTMIG